MTELFELSYSEIAPRLKDGSVTVSTYIESLLSRIQNYNPKVNALRYVNAEGARELAAKLDQEFKKNKTPPPLFGLSFSAKDTLSVKGLPWSEGTSLGAIEQDENSSECVNALLTNGAICLGKGNMSEYGKSYFTENVPFGKTSNPWDLSRSPGGSSGGESAAVASGMVPVGLCADSGGSIRVPASFCGVFGLYPTRGTISSSGLRAWTHTLLSLFRSPGIITRTLDDLELTLKFLSYYDNKDPYSTPSTSELQPRKKKFCFLSSLNGVQVCSEITDSVKEVSKKFESVGFIPEDFTPKQFEGSFEIFILLAGQASLVIDDILGAERGLPRDPSKESLILQALRHRVATELPPITTERLLWAWSRVDKLRHEIVSVFEKYDFVLMPVAASLAPKHGTVKYDIDGTSRQSQEVFQFASSVNVLGLPSIAFPTGISKEGLPIGLQIVGPRFSDGDLIDYLKIAGFLSSRHPV